MLIAWYECERCNIGMKRQQLTGYFSVKLDIHVSEFTFQNLHHHELVGTDKIRRFRFTTVQCLRHPVAELFDT